MLVRQGVAREVEPSDVDVDAALRDVKQNPGSNDDHVVDKEWLPRTDFIFYCVQVPDDNNIHNQEVEVPVAIGREQHEVPRLFIELLKHRALNSYSLVTRKDSSGVRSIDVDEEEKEVGSPAPL